MAFEFIGTINPKRRIDFTSWTALVSRYAQLSLADSCEIINPFTNETETIEYPSEFAEVVVDGRQVGALRWYRHGESIDAFGDVEIVGAIARGLAKELSGRFVSRDEC